MPIVNIKGVGEAQFPDDMPRESIRDVLRKKFYKGFDSPQQQNVIEPVEQSLAQKGGQAVSDFLFENGFVDDRYRAQQLGGKVQAVGEFLPGLGDAAAGDEFGRAVREGDVVGMGVNALGAIPFAGDAAIFAGALAKNADLGALKRAVSLEGMGKNRDEVWKETGWVNDKGDWKFEISDRPAESKAFVGTGSKRIPETLKHDELFDAYPDLKGLTISKGKSGNYYVPQFKTIRMSSTEKAANDVVKKYAKLEDEILDEADELNQAGKFTPDMEADFEKRISDLSEKARIEVESTTGETFNKSIQMHELQHTVQEQEGFARGGSSEEFELPSDLVKESIDTWGNVSLLKRFSESKGDDVAVKRFEMLLGRKPTDLESNLSKSKSFDEIAKSQRELKQGPLESYRRLGGEAEARNVQTRLDWTPEQRRATPPWQSLDVPEDELIYRK